MLDYISRVKELRSFILDDRTVAEIDELIASFVMDCPF